MSEHYYTAAPTSAHAERTFNVEVGEVSLGFTTDAGVFSRDGLDPGSRLLIESAGPVRGRALDLGCGWGAVGAFLARLNPEAEFVLSDVNERAVELARRNIARNGLKNASVALGDGFTNLAGAFDFIFTNPPIRAGKQAIYALFESAGARLNPGGALVIVIRKQQGAPSALAFLRGIFACAEVIARGGGYWIIRARV